MKPTLDGVKAKIAQAKRHSDLFDGKYKEWRNSMLAEPPITVESDTLSRKPTFIIKAPPPDPTLSLIIGDCLHNLRVSLDHLAGQLASLDGYDVMSYSNLAFPIYTSESKYKSARKKIEKFIKNQDVIKVIDAIQPFHRKDPNTDPLWVLSNLDNIDKHRALVVVAPRINKGQAQESAGSAEHAKQIIGSYGPYSIDFQIEISPPNDKTSLEEDRAARTITIRSDATLVLADTGLPCDNWSVQKSVQLITDRVQGIINKFDKQFFVK